ncbi:TPA: GpE family phage tail protein [Escherichia coli]|nr:GpE family phage tail protein [Escherichia coli]
MRATRVLTQAQGLLARWFRFQPGEIDALDTDDLEMWLEQAEEQIKSEYGDKS